MLTIQNLDLYKNFNKIKQIKFITHFFRNGAEYGKRWDENLLVLN